MRRSTSALLLPFASSVARGGEYFRPERKGSGVSNRSARCTLGARCASSLRGLLLPFGPGRSVWRRKAESGGRRVGSGD
ncbi:hypothetical protein FB451DRAFT_394280 [Mycena latifolia]|nr:hypothetical protein FB451DRAFT_394280 [Mycena latifolia]